MITIKHVNNNYSVVTIDGGVYEVPKVFARALEKELNNTYEIKTNIDF